MAPKKGVKSNKEARKERRQTENANIEALCEKVKTFDEPSSALSKFEDLPLSPETKNGLRSAHYTDLTDVQKECIVPALKNQDLLVAARTGSGKTLGFLVPVLEKLYTEKWTAMDGVGAIVITPTRELAIQIFEVLRRIGSSHKFSAGLLIGGNNINAEKDKVSKLNILICTPGRLLQHMDESYGFETYNLQMLVLDEADRILDMGFKRSIDAIVQNLPPQRQTLLFSATQTKSVGDLARLSLVSPMYISVHEQSLHGATPEKLEQFYSTVPVDEKLDVLWSFLRAHTKNKIIVFLSSSKQVRFVYESFRRMQPGIPLLHLHGRQKQTSRVEVTEKFSRSRSSCLLATDVVARGIDFPEVDWVVQVDCPEDSATYVHRVGRSARAGKSGRALLLLTPDEEVPFLVSLKARKVPIEKLNIRETKKSTIRSDLQAQCFKDAELKYLGQKAFISYVRSVYVASNKDVFNIEKLPLEKLAKSFGLASAPHVKIKGVADGSSSGAHDIKNKPRALQPQKDKEKEKRTRYERMFERQNQDILSEHYQKMYKKDANATDTNDDGEFMTIKRVDHDIGEDDGTSIHDEPDDERVSSKVEVQSAQISKREAKRALSKKQIAKTQSSGQKVLFDDEGKPHQLYEFQNEEDFERAGAAEEQRRAFIDVEAKDMADRDISDKAIVKQKRAEKKRHRKEMERLAREGLSDESDDAGGHSDNSFASFESDNDVVSAPKRARRNSRRNSESIESIKPIEPIEVDEPETLADLEALSARLLRR